MLAMHTIPDVDYQTYWPLQLYSKIHMSIVDLSA